jgi:hypothetical protein
VVCNFFNAVFFWCFQPETKGLNLEDMNELFRDSPTFVPGSKWVPSSHVDEIADDIAKRDKHSGDNTVEHVEDLVDVERRR